MEKHPSSVIREDSEHTSYPLFFFATVTTHQIVVLCTIHLRSLGLTAQIEETLSSQVMYSFVKQGSYVNKYTQ